MFIFILKDPDLLATADWSRAGPLIKAVLTRSFLLGTWNGAWGLLVSLGVRAEKLSYSMEREPIVLCVNGSRENWREKGKWSKNTQLLDIRCE